MSAKFKLPMQWFLPLLASRATVQSVTQDYFFLVSPVEKELPLQILLLLLFLLLLRRCGERY
jgi:hypothetical protein